MRDFLAAILVCIISCSCAQKIMKRSDGEARSFPTISLEEVQEAIAVQEAFICDVQKGINSLKEDRFISGAIDVSRKGSFRSDPDDHSIISLRMTVVVDELNDHMIKDIDEIVYQSMKAFGVHWVDLFYLIKTHQSVLSLPYESYNDPSSDVIILHGVNMGPIEEGIYRLNSEKYADNDIDIDDSGPFAFDQNDIGTVGMTVVVDELNDKMIEDIDAVISSSIQEKDIGRVEIEYLVTSHHSMLAL